MYPIELIMMSVARRSGQKVAKMGVFLFVCEKGIAINEFLLMSDVFSPRFRAYSEIFRRLWIFGDQFIGYLATLSC